jgi:sulfite exporter TauE/SafE
MTTVLAGFALGLAGSAHCAAMCGPLVAAVSPRGLRAAFYHAGRWTTYVTLGLASGAAGGGLATAGLGRWAAFVIAALLVAQAVGLWTASRTRPSAIRAAITSGVSAMARWAHARPSVAPMVLGIGNGLIPCGLVYAAATAAAAQGRALDGALFMAAFGAGTTPILAGLGAWVSSRRARLPLAWKRLAPVALVALAVLIVVRGVVAPAHAH